MIEYLTRQQILDSPPVTKSIKIPFQLIPQEGRQPTEYQTIELELTYKKESIYFAGEEDPEDKGKSYSFIDNLMKYLSYFLKFGSNTKLEDKMRFPYVSKLDIFVIVDHNSWQLVHELILYHQKFFEALSGSYYKYQYAFDFNIGKSPNICQFFGCCAVSYEEAGNKTKFQLCYDYYIDPCKIAEKP